MKAILILSLVCLALSQNLQQDMSDFNRIFNEIAGKSEEAKHIQESKPDFSKEDKIGQQQVIPAPKK